ncbi:PorT family protein [Polaribacter aestuariivivens]|uniref:PorT family protein n=1 Tax=Polaribacter aestuariivivens TaxID=2304626 RepID=A0A5S3NA37_9FLAO|nr:PorT family protein [Polaribacter aestuariivivens]TMM30459.1 PorT family protein [Polaribacter aestuariivivens]
MENKNIDRLFQEQLKNLEATPNKKVWNNIEAKLTKKKRKVFPFWWFSGGIAALFLIGLFLFPIADEKPNNINNDVIITEKSTNKEELKNNTPKTVDSIILNNKTTTDVLIANEKPTEKNKLDKKLKNPNHKKEFVANNTTTLNEKKKVSSKNVMKKNFIANNSSSDKKFKKDKTTNKNDTVSITKIEIKPKKDILAVVKSKENSVKESSKKQWSIAPVFAVLNSNSFTNSSSLDANLASSTSGENTYAYGVKVAYEINKKWTIQTGVQLQEMQYTNNQIAVISSRNAMSNVAFKNGNSVSFQNVASDNFDVNASALSSVVTFSGNLTQNFGYVEIPIEIKYNVLESSKFQTQIVAGFSSLFLRKNEVLLQTDSFTNTGTANNLNDLNFSGNFGFDFNYNFDKKWSFYVNPMFKAQLNTYSENSNGFSPFNMGIYTGINYQF